MMSSNLRIAVRRRMMLALALSAPAAVALVVAACATASSDNPTPPDAATVDSAIPSASSSSGSSDSLDAADDGADLAVDAGHGDYTYGDWSDWSNCSETCDAGVKTRTRICKRADGIAVNCTLCGGQCTDTTPCTAAVCCGKPREECCPKMPYNVVGGDMTWCTTTLSDYAAKCADAGCLWTGATACTNGGSPSNSTLPGGQGTCQ